MPTATQDDKSTQTPAAEPAAPVTFDKTLEEFCAEASANGYGVELLGGFHADALSRGQLKAGHDAFQAALDAFANRAV